MASCKVLSSPDLLVRIAKNVSSDADLSALSRCNRTIRENTLPHLYRDLEITYNNVSILAAIIKANRLSISYCRTLIIRFDVIWGQEFKRKLHDLAFVLNECLAQGLLTSFQWSEHRNSYDLAAVTLQDELQVWEKLSPLSKTLRSLTLGSNSVTGTGSSTRTLKIVSNTSFPAVSDLTLSVGITSADVPNLRRFLSMVPNAESIYFWGDLRELTDESLFPNIIFDGLKSLSIVTISKNIDAGLFTLFPRTFLNNQPALIEFRCIPHLCIFKPDRVAPPSNLKALCAICDGVYYRASHCGANFRSLVVLRLHVGGRNFDGSWIAFIKELPNLKCLEMFQELFVNPGQVVLGAIGNEFMENLQRDIIEYHLDSHLPSSVSNEGAFEICMSIKRLGTILSSCSTSQSLRAIHLSYNWVFSGTQKPPEKLLDEYDLQNIEMPPSLEYVLWETPWLKRLYGVVRDRDTVRLVYSGYDRLPGRPHYSSLSWTNETVLDHLCMAT